MEGRKKDTRTIKISQDARVSGNSRSGHWGPGRGARPLLLDSVSLEDETRLVFSKDVFMTRDRRRCSTEINIMSHL